MSSPISDDSSTLSMMKLLYGADDELPVVLDSDKFPFLSPKHTLRSPKDKRTIPKPRISLPILSIKRNKGSSKRKSQTLLSTHYVPADRSDQYKSEPYLYIWHKSNIVKKCLNEFQNLPFKSVIGLQNCCESFIDEISTIVRKMKIEGCLEFPDLSKNQTIFTNGAIEARKKVLFEAVNNRQLDFLRLSPRLRETFLKGANQERAKLAESIEYEKKIYDSIIDNISDIPRPYKLCSYNRQKRNSTSSVDAFAHTCPIPPIKRIGIVTPITNEGKSNLPPLMKNTQRGLAWDETETLTNESRRKQLEMLQEPAKEFKIELKDYSKEKKIIPDFLKVKNESSSSSSSCSTIRSNYVPSMSSLPKVITPIASKHDFLDDVDFLNEKSTNVLLNETGDEYFRRLDEVWDKLEFSVIQRLQMATKYSINTELSSQLHKALPMWEEAAKATDLFNNEYKELKLFLESENFNINSKEYDALYTTFQNQCDVILSFSRHLQQNYGDDLIIKRRKATDIIIERRAKITQLIELHN